MFELSWAFLLDYRDHLITMYWREGNIFFFEAYLLQYVCLSYEIQNKGFVEIVS